MKDKTKLGLILAGVSAGVITKTLMDRASDDAMRGSAVLVTGGSPALRSALAREFARAGCRIAIVGDEAEVNRACLELQKGGASVTTHPCDVSDREQVKNLIGAVTNEFGHIDVIINNAGPSYHRDATSLPAGTAGDDFGDVMNGAMGGVATASLSILPMLLARNEGKIVNVTFIGADVNISRKLAYNAASAAATAFSESLSAELAGTGVQVITLAEPLPVSAARSATRIAAAVRRGEARPGSGVSFMPGLAGTITQNLPGLVLRRLVSASRNERSHWIPPSLNKPALRILLGLGRIAVRRLADRAA